MDVKRITVAGAGTMGHGIALVALVAGYDVCLTDIAEGALERARGAIDSGLAKSVEKGKLDAAAAGAARARLTTSLSLADACRDVDLFIEAAPESLPLKCEIFKTAAASASSAAVLATNTSSLPVTAIARAATHPERVVGMHFFNPPIVLKLLEIVRGFSTSEATVEIACAVGVRMEREIVVVKDSPGFASSRLGVLLGLEAIRMIEQGVASAADIDKAMKVGYRLPMGPLELTDLVGLDVRLAIAEHLHAELGETFRPPQLLKTMVRAGKLGKKSGEGFYKYGS